MATLRKNYQLTFSLMHLLKRLWVCHSQKVSKRVKLDKDCRKHNYLDEIAQNHLNIKELYSSRDTKVVIVLTETHSSHSFSQQTKSLFIVSDLYFLHCSSDRLWNRQQRQSHWSFTKFPSAFSSLEHKRSMKTQFDFCSRMYADNCWQIKLKISQSYFPSLCGQTNQKVKSPGRLFSSLFPSPLLFIFSLPFFPFARASNMAASLISTCFSLQKTAATQAKLEQFFIHWFEIWHFYN